MAVLSRESLILSAQRMKNKKEILIGIVILGALCVLYFGVFYLKNGTFLISRNVFYTISPHTENLTPASKVLVKGFPVGSIRQIQPAGAHIPHFIFTIALNQKLNIPQGSYLTITAPLLGNHNLELVLNTANEQMYVSGDTLPLHISASDQSTPTLLVQKACQLMDSLQNLVGFSQQTLRHTMPYVAETVKQTALLSRQLHQLSLHIAPTLVSIRQITKNIEKSSQDLPHITENLNNFSNQLQHLNIEELQQTLTQLQQTSGNIRQITEDILSGKGSLGKMTQDSSLYHNLNNATEQLHLLLKDVKAHPARYIHIQLFGKKNKKASNGS